MLSSMLFAVVAVIPEPAEIWSYGNNEAVPVSVPVVVEKDASQPDEGYWLDIRPEGKIVISCSDAAGEYYARQTLRQLADWRGYPCVVVKDKPTYNWRGMHFDDCRHFFGKDVLKKTLDVMAQYKMNVLHWHLTDDQGWRLDIPGYPELVKYGAMRSASPKHGAKMCKDAAGDWKMDLNGRPYGPYYYTEADVKEILTYAAERHITVVPEIELPGHVFAALAAYPEFACFPENLKARSPRLIWGIEKDVLCLGNDKAIKFMEDVIDYVCRLFPSEVIHIGGDECPQERWKTCPKCQQRITDQKLGDEKGLQPWITRRFVKFLADRGKRSLGWDEYLLGDGIPKTAIGMSWRIGKQGAGHDWLSPADLAAKGHDVVMTPNDYCYLDYAQGLEADPFQYIGGCITLVKCHSLDLCEGVPEKDHAHILGGQGNNWSEYTWNQYDLEWKMWPRGCALAEVFWCGNRKPQYDDFLRRMKVHRTRLMQQGVNCAPLE